MKYYWIVKEFARLVLWLEYVLRSLYGRYNTENTSMIRYEYYTPTCKSNDTSGVSFYLKITSLISHFPKRMALFLQWLKSNLSNIFNPRGITRIRRLPKITQNRFSLFSLPRHIHMGLIPLISVLRNKFISSLPRANHSSGFIPSFP